MSDTARTEPPENSFHPETRAAWREWLKKNHQRTEGVWLISYKKATGKPRIEYDDAVEEALCFGWVDSKPGKLDEERTMLYFAPRKSGSGWAKSNKQRVEKLLAAGLMAPAGLAKVEAARKDSSWSALDEVEELTIPPDLEKALAEYGQARDHFDAFPRSVRRGILEWIARAISLPTRARRIEETARLAQNNIRANQWPKS